MRHYKLFGTLEIVENDTLIELMKSQKGCAIFVYLILTRETQQREHIADLLWDTETTKRALANLRGMLPRLRDGNPELVVTRKTLAFEQHGQLAVDLYELEEVLNQAEPAWGRLDQVLRLYVGDLLHGFYIEDAPRFNEWLLFVREGWRRRVLDAYRRLCQQYESAEMYKQGINATERWLALDDLDEDAYRMLMRQLAEDGQAAVALNQFERCCQRLRDELGVEPEPETVQLAEQIRNLISAEKPTEPWRPKARAEEPIRPKADELADIGHLPPHSYLPHHRNSDFLGRQAALLHLAQRLLPNADETPPTTRTAAISGIGGLGKTQLAVEFAFRYGRFFRGGVYWLSFAEAGSVPDEVVTIGGVQGMKLYREADKLSIDEKIGRVKAAWQLPKPRLLIFDNCEDDALLAKWLPVTGGCRVLLTSRRAVWPRELQVETWSLGNLTPHEGTALLTRLAPAVEPQAASQISDAVGHLPLALHLAGSFLARYKRITGTQYLRQLDDLALRHPSLQGRGISYSPTGHELSVASTFAINLEQLDSADEIDRVTRRLLAYAAQFAPGEPLPRAILLSTVIDDPFDVMAELTAEDGFERLMALGFLTRESETHISVHRLIAVFARDALHDVSDAADHVQAKLVDAMNAVADYRPNWMVLPFATAHLRYVTEAAIRSVSKQALPLGRQLSLHLSDIGDNPSAQAYLVRILPLARQQDDPWALVAVLRAIAIVHIDAWSFELALPFLEEAITLAGKQPSSDDAQMAHLNAKYGYALASLGRYDAARPSFEVVANALSSDISIRPLLRYGMLKLLGDYRVMLGSYAEAMVAYQEAALVLEKTYPAQSFIETATILTSIGSLHTYSGAFEAGREESLKALAIAEALVDDTNDLIIILLGNLGVIEWRIGDFSLAHTYFERALRASQAIYDGDHPVLAAAFNDVGEVLCKLEEHEEALQMHRRAWAMRNRFYGSDHYETLRSLSMIGEVQLRSGALAEARGTLEAALLGQESAESNPQAISDTVLLLGETLLALGRLPEAQTQITRALSIRQEAFGDNNPETAYARFILGKWHQAIGDLEVACRCFRDALATLKQTTIATHPNLIQVQEVLAQFYCL